MLTQTTAESSAATTGVPDGVAETFLAVATGEPTLESDVLKAKQWVEEYGTAEQTRELLRLVTQLQSSHSNRPIVVEYLRTMISEKQPAAPPRKQWPIIVGVGVAAVGLTAVAWYALKRL
jgi:hypothetical protein